MSNPDSLPFIAYRKGRWSLRIVPRNGEGWRAIALWSVPLLMLTTGHVALSASAAGARHPALFPIMFVTACIIWGIAMTRWMLERAEVIHVPDGFDMRRKADRDRLAEARRDQSRDTGKATPKG